MSEVLRSYDQFDTDELAASLHELARENSRLLRRRRLGGVVARYGDTLDLAKEKVEKGQHETTTGELEHFAVLNREGQVRGGASIFPGLELTCMKLPIHPRLLPGFFKRRFPHANPNVSAWEADGNEKLLSSAYKELVARVPQYIPASGIRDIPWTTEPLLSPPYVKRAIVASGLSHVATRFYYEGDGGAVIGPSTLYAHTLDWLTAHGRLHELETGDWHGSSEEIMSRNPRGH